MSTELGRFLQPDPIGFKGDASNLYRYCDNDPVDRSDPTGLYSPLTMFGGRDWIKGSDGLDAWDRTVGGMPSNRWEAGPEGAGSGGKDKSEPGRARGPNEATIQTGRRVLARQSKEGEDTTGAFLNGKPISSDKNWKQEDVPYKFGKPVYKNPNDPCIACRKVDHIEEVVPPGRSDLLTHYHTREGVFAEPTHYDMRVLKTTGAMLFSNPALRAEGAYRIYRYGVPGYQVRHDLYDP